MCLSRPLGMWQVHSRRKHKGLSLFIPKLKKMIVTLSKLCSIKTFNCGIIHVDFMRKGEIQMMGLLKIP